MRTLVADEAALEAARTTLLSGGVVVIPTDTVYGLAAHPDFPAAVERLYAIKQREAKKPIALLASDPAAVSRFLKCSLDPVAERLATRYWPGPLTLVLNGEGFRLPDHEWTRKLLASVGGVLRVSSANLSGQRPATDAPAALQDVGLSADLVIDGGVSPGGVASTVAKVEAGEITLLREGPVKFLILASGSPRRAKILRSLGVDFVVRKSDAPEVSYPGDPVRTVSENALAKQSVPPQSPVPPQALRGGILSADTIVWFDNKIYGKPRDLEEAKTFLRELSGKTHTVFTGVAYNGEAKVVTSGVTFRELTEAEIDEYVARVKPTDRAGAYDIDESGDFIVASYTGEYENIMGLPIAPLREWHLCS